MSRDAIVRAAIELLDAEGMDALSMRKLGARLASGATSIYWYVESKDQLLELIMDAVYGEVTIPPEDEWRDAATAFANGMRQSILRHPWLVNLVGAIPAIGPNAMTISERLVAASRAAGFEGKSLDYATAAITSYTLGASIPEAVWENAHRKSGMSIAETMQSMAPMLKDIADDYPNLREMFSRYYETPIDVDETRLRAFEFGLNALLDGLEACLP